MTTVDHRAVQALLASGAQVVETLPAHEYRTAHIRGAIHLPLPRLWRHASPLLSREHPVVVYCRDSL
jgi:rhodanese-related sulfurtransferase